jgi:hypothetical protein
MTIEHNNGDLNIVQLTTGAAAVAGQLDGHHYLYALATDGYAYWFNTQTNLWEQVPGEIDLNTIG